MAGDQFAGDGIPVAGNDILSVTIDQGAFPVRLDFKINGQPTNDASVSGVKGEVWPAVGVSEGAIVEILFDEADFTHYPPGSAFGALMHCRSII